jgi:Holliday junction DNA helicase RuvB
MRVMPRLIPHVDTLFGCAAWVDMAQPSPISLDGFLGQERAKQQITYSLQAAKMGKPLPHILLDGPAGVGKTTLARLIAKALNVQCKVVDARNLKSVKEFIDFVSDLKDCDVLFIDEIHGLSTAVAELMYNIMLDFGYYYNIGKKQLWIELHNFVIIGATTQMGELPHPLRTRFGITANLELYDEDTLSEMAVSNAVQLGRLITQDAAIALARSARGTARVLNNLLDRADDIVRVWGTRLIDEEVATHVLMNFGIDERGLSVVDRKFLKAIGQTYKNQPVGISTLAALLGENEDTLVEVVEPYLLRRGLVQKTPRGRILTEHGLEVAA